MPLTAATSAREILIGLHEIMAKRGSAQVELNGVVDLMAEDRAILASALRRAVIDGDAETGSVMAGQSVGMVTREEPLAEFIRDLVDKASAGFESRG